jgi:transposase InsO family protein
MSTESGGESTSGLASANGPDTQSGNASAGKGVTKGSWWHKFDASAALVRVMETRNTGALQKEVDKWDAPAEVLAELRRHDGDIGSSHKFIIQQVIMEVVAAKSKLASMLERKISETKAQATQQLSLLASMIEKSRVRGGPRERSTPPFSPNLSPIHASVRHEILQQPRDVVKEERAEGPMAPSTLFTNTTLPTIVTASEPTLPKVAGTYKGMVYDCTSKLRSSFNRWSTQFESYMLLNGCQDVINYEDSSRPPSSDLNTLKRAMAIAAFTVEGSALDAMELFRTKHGAPPRIHDWWHWVRDRSEILDFDEVDELKRQFLDTALPTTSSLREDVIKFFDSFEHTANEIRKYDMTWSPDEDSLRRRIFDQIKPRFKFVQALCDDTIGLMALRRKILKLVKQMGADETMAAANITDTSGGYRPGSKFSKSTSGRAGGGNDVWVELTDTCPVHPGQHTLSACTTFEAGKSNCCRRFLAGVTVKGRKFKHAKTCSTGSGKANHTQDGKLSKKQRKRQKESIAAAVAADRQIREATTDTAALTPVLGATTTKPSTLLEVQSQAGNAIKVNGSWYVLGAQITTSLKVACIADDPLDLAVVVPTTTSLATVDVCSDSGAQRPVFRQDVVNSHPHFFERVNPTNFPVAVVGMYGKPSPVIMVVRGRLPLRTVTGQVFWLQLEGILVTADGTTNLASEECIVQATGCVYYHSRQGKFIIAATGECIELERRNGLFWLPYVGRDNSHSLTPPPYASTTLLTTQLDESRPQIEAGVHLTTNSNQWFVDYHAHYLLERARDLNVSEAFVANVVSTKLAESQVNVQRQQQFSKKWSWLKSLLGYRSEPQVAEVARRWNIKLTSKDERLAAKHSGLSGHGRVKPDPQRPRTPRKPGELLAQDPVTLKGRCYGGITTVFFTVDAATRRVRVFKANSKATANAIRAVEEFCRRSGHGRPKLIQTDTDAIYLSTEWQDWCRQHQVKDRMSPPYHHRANSVVESKIGTIWSQALSMMLAAKAWWDCDRSIEEFFHFALSHAADVDSLLTCGGMDDGSSPHQLETGDRPHYSRVLLGHWGQPVQVIVAKERRRSKLVGKTVPGFFLGVSQHHERCGLVFSPTTGKIIISSDIYFSKDPQLGKHVPMLYFDDVEIPYDDPILPRAATTDDDDVDADDDDYQHSGGGSTGSPTRVDVTPRQADAGDVLDETLEPVAGGQAHEVEPLPPTSSTCVPLNPENPAKYEATEISPNTIDVRVHMASVVNISKDTPTQWGSDSWWDVTTLTADEVHVDSQRESLFTGENKELLFEDDCPITSTLFLGDVPHRSTSPAFAFKSEQLWSLAGIQSLPKDEQDAAWAAVRKELQSHVDNQTWETVDKVPPGKKKIKTRGFLIRKPIRIDGKITYKFKYRLVACGYSQDDTHFDKSESPVISAFALHMYFTVCASEQLDMFHGDFTTAFLKSFLEKDVDLYGLLPNDLPAELAGKLVKILKAWYGLKQSSRLHFDTTVGLILSFGFEQSGSEPCVFNLVCDGRTHQADGTPVRRQWPEMWSNNTDVYGKRMHHTFRLGLYVDDIPMGITRGNPLKEQFLDHLRSVFEVTIEPLNFFLNCEMEYDRGNRTMYLAQRFHTKKCVEMIMGTSSGIHKTRSPMEPGYSPNLKGIEGDNPDFMSEQNRVERYRSMTCALLWLTRTRPDIAFAVTALCKFLKAPRPQHWNDLKRVARYLAGTPNRGLCFQPTSLTLSAYSDSDWATDVTTRKSVSGSVILLGGCPIYFKSQQQRVQALSSMEAETYALSTTSQTVEFGRRLLVDFGYEQAKPTTIYVDNQATIAMSKSVLMSWRSRHIPIRDLRIRELCQGDVHRGVAPSIAIVWVASPQNFADGLTKSQAVADFEAHQDFHTKEVPF